MKIIHFSKTLVFVMLSVWVLVACDKQENSPKKQAADQPIAANSDNANNTNNTDNNPSSETNVSIDLSRVKLDQQVSSVSLAALSVWVSGGTDVDYVNYETSSEVTAGAPQTLTKSKTASEVVFKENDGIVLNYDGIDFTQVEAFNSLSFSQDLPAGAKVAVYNGDQLVASSQ